MRNISTVLSVIALVLVGVLFYLHFSTPKEAQKGVPAAGADKQNSFKIAYFDIDSLQEHYDYYNDALEQMKKHESSAGAELQDLKNKFQRRIAELQKKGPTMTQSEDEAARQEVGVMDQNYRKKESELQERLQNRQLEFRNDVRKQIEDYLKVYNKDQKYSYIVSYESNFIIYNKDSAYDITNDIIRGLNEQYKAKKKE
ncbi:MAG: OmpH family outer membrane protein [Chitinophagaceae bacterium]